jgi:hypothetical protein
VKLKGSEHVDMTTIPQKEAEITAAPLRVSFGVVLQDYDITERRPTFIVRFCYIS